MKIKDIPILVKGCVVFSAMGLTAFLVSIVCYKAGAGHRMISLLEMPFRLRGQWISVFYALWAFYWLALWFRLANITKDPVAKKVHISSWAVAGALAVLWFALMRGKIHISPSFMMNPGALALKKAAWKLLGVCFPVTGLGALLFTVMDRLGIIHADPIEREMKGNIRWNRWVNHDKYLKKAAQKGLTYLGFEVTFGDPIFLNSQERNDHIHVVGTTGSGKTRYVLFPHDPTRHHGRTRCDLYGWQGKP